MPFNDNFWVSHEVSFTHAIDVRRRCQMAAGVTYSSEHALAAVRGDWCFLSSEYYFAMLIV
ncbi:hypothetical protein [Paraburkholderia terrae]|uniref:Uncharacterized protein n=1 Tax=Paraburkholderia terrae TaxID=311230 RepID=A0ABM7TZC3_9BURK|nr:hypothetical protein [Paraburkholderia terrae]BCZ84448.1 hypothetical protein PTKU64_81230 [Paraburkholderia terrae]BDC45698.1 hypothetical protein PTKU15_89950 [Paraburkholderia terrae]